MIKKIESITCPCCGVILPSEDEYKNHMLTHIVTTEQFLCPDCGNKYTDYEEAFACCKHKGIIFAAKYLTRECHRSAKCLSFCPKLEGGKCPIQMSKCSEVKISQWIMKLIEMNK